MPKRSGPKLPPKLGNSVRNVTISSSSLLKRNSNTKPLLTRHTKVSYRNTEFNSIKPEVNSFRYDVEGQVCRRSGQWMLYRRPEMYETRLIARYTEVLCCSLLARAPEGVKESNHHTPMCTRVAGNIIRTHQIPSVAAICWLVWKIVGNLEVPPEIYRFKVDSHM